MGYRLKNENILVFKKVFRSGLFSGISKVKPLQWRTLRQIWNPTSTLVHAQFSGYWTSPAAKNWETYFLLSQETENCSFLVLFVCACLLRVSCWPFRSSVSLLADFFSISCHFTQYGVTFISMTKTIRNILFVDVWTWLDVSCHSEQKQEIYAVLAQKRKKERPIGLF